MWDGLPIEVQDLIVSMTGEARVRDHEIVFSDLVHASDANGVRAFARTTRMATVRGVSAGRVCACTQPDLPLVESVEAAPEEWVPSWTRHFMLIALRTADGRLWADNSMSGWTHIGYHGRYGVYRHPRACLLARRYAERVDVMNILLFRHVQICHGLDNRYEGVHVDRLPAIVMHVA